MIVRLLTTLVILLLSVNSYAENTADTHFLVLTDIHLDPFLACEQTRHIPCPLIEKLQAAPVSEWSAILKADATLPKRHRDTPYSLFAYSLKQAKQAAQSQHIQFVLLLGDMLGHDYREYYKQYMHDRSRAHYQAFVKKTLTFINDEIAQAFPNVDIYSLVGNNDSYRSNYHVDPDSVFFSDLATIWGSTIKEAANRVAMQQQFKTAGYYALDLPGQKQVRLIMLNSVLFSAKCKGKHCTPAADHEMTWLHQQLLLARDHHQHVILAMHIPEGIDVNASLPVRLFRLLELWRSEYTARIQIELKEFAPELIGIFAGHLHADWFQVERFDGAHEVPVLGTQSISPIYGNDPGFKIYSYSNQTLQVNDYKTYSVSLSS